MQQRITRFTALSVVGLLFYFIAWVIDSQSLDSILNILTFQREDSFTTISGSIVTLIENSIDIIFILLAITFLEILLGDLSFLKVFVVIALFIGLYGSIVSIINIFNGFGFGYGFLSILSFIVSIGLVGFSYFMIDILKVLKK